MTQPLRQSARATAPKLPPYAVESVDSALKLLRMFCTDKQIRISEAAERLGVAQSTAHRLMSMLVYHGFAMQEGRGREYRAGPMLIEIGFAGARDLDIRQQARPFLETLHAKVNETVHLAIPYGNQVLYVEAIESRHLLRVGSRVGTFAPAHCIALGKSLLATLTIEQLHALYPDAELPVLTERSLGSRAELERQLAKIRTNGYARSRGESDRDVGSIAVAVCDRAGVARASISIAAPLSRIDGEREAVWSAAAKAAAEALRARLWTGPEINAKKKTNPTPKR